MKGTKRIGIGLVALGLCLTAGLVGAAEEKGKADYAELVAAKYAAQAASDYQAYAEIGAQMMQTPEAATNAVVMASSAAVRVVGLFYAVDKAAALSEYERLLPQIPAEARALFSRNTWAHWAAKESGVITAARCIEDVADEVAAIRSGKSALDDSYHLSVMVVYCGALLVEGRTADAKEAADWILATWGARAMNSLYFLRVAVRAGAGQAVAQAVAQMANPVLRARSEYELASEQRDTAAANAAVIGVLSREARTLPPRELDAWFARLDPVPMSGVDYLAALQAILKATPATETNAAFLGRVKSELEKMK